MIWSLEDAKWITAVDDLFTKTFGEDFLAYKWDKALRSVVISPESIPAFNCDRAVWEDALNSLSSTVKSNSVGTTNTSAAPLNVKVGFDHKPPATSSKQLSLPEHTTALKQKFDCKQPVSLPSYSSDLRACVNKASTRCQLAKLNLPPVVQIEDDEIELVSDARHFINPLMLGARPSESTVSKCQQLINQASNEDDESDVAIKLGNLGVFRTHALDIWRRAFLAADLKRKVAVEERWLSNSSTALSASQSQEVSSLLFNSKPQEEVLRFGNIIIDVNDISTLAGERYLTGFIIDGACLKYCKEAQGNGAHSLYLPSMTQTWALSGDSLFLSSKLKPFISGKVQNLLQWLLTPIMVNDNHWGLLCINMTSCQAYFDDGLKVYPPRNICDIIKNLFEAVNSLVAERAKSPLQHFPPVQRFGMPLQPQTGEGCGSCGMGVILAAKDFLNVGGAIIPQFNWRFGDMTKHRQQLLYQFVQWKQSS